MATGLSISDYSSRGRLNFPWNSFAMVTAGAMVLRDVAATRSPRHRFGGLDSGANARSNLNPSIGRSQLSRRHWVCCQQRNMVCY